MKGKSAVAGLLERDGEVRAHKVPNTSGYHLRPFINENVAFGSTVNTDEWGGYNGVAQRYQHKRINHLLGEYVNGETHTNGIEGFWSQLKRSVYGCYHSVSDKHLQNYIDESVFRYNTREISEQQRFFVMLSHITKHTTYKQLIHDDSRINQQAQPQPDLFSPQA